MQYRIIFDRTLQQDSPLNETQEELPEVRGQLDSTLRELEEMKRKLQEKEAEHNATRIQLTETVLNLDKTKTQLEKTELQLKETMDTKCALQKGSITKWDFFYSCEYYNKILTRKLHKELQTSLISLTNRSLIGVNMTDQAIELIKQLHEEETCE